MKKSLLKITSIIFIIFIYSINTTIAQETTPETLSKDELKLQKLEEKVSRIEEKIRLTEIKIAQADSLINAGYEMAEQAHNELDVISSEEKLFLKENNTKRKELLKQLKKADDEDAKGIEAEIKKLELEYKTETKSISKRYSVEDKKLVKAKSNDSKGKEKLKQYNPKLKEYKKALEEAEEVLEDFRTEKEM